MTSYDVVMFHPPAIYDFRRRPIFPGAMGPSVEALQYIKVPIGMLSIAEYLDRHGYQVIIDNLGDRMVDTIGFDVEAHIQSYSARIFAVGLHFQQHIQGALEIAGLCKRYHPDAMVVLGGLTATCFHEEIIEKIAAVDAVVRAEAEKPMLALVEALDKGKSIAHVPNLTFRENVGKPTVTPLLPASHDLDDYEYTRFDLLSPKTSIFTSDSCFRYSLEVCRGCVYNCAICGGSAYTYKKYLGMSRPAFRSPQKIVRDMKRLNDSGIFFIGLFQDPRMGGKGYWQELFATIKKERPRFERLSLDLLIPADEDFIKEISSIGRQVVLHLCPDTGSERVRNLLGRHYSNRKLIDTIKLCYRYGIPVSNFFSVGLAGETENNVKATWALWDQLNELERQALEQGRFDDIFEQIPIGGPILGPIVLDPGSRAFDTPEKYGYRLIYRDLTSYLQGLSQPSWHQWLNYETSLLSRDEIVRVIQDSVGFTIDQNEKYRIFDKPEADFKRILLEMDRLIVDEVNKLENVSSEREKRFRIVSMRKNLDQYLQTRQLPIN